MYGLKPVPFKLKPAPFKLKPAPFKLKPVPFKLARYAGPIDSPLPALRDSAHGIQRQD